MKKSFSSVKYYFAVDQSYVVKKLCLLLFPFRPRVSVESQMNQPWILSFLFRTGHWRTAPTNLFHRAWIPMHPITTFHVSKWASLLLNTFISLSISDECHYLCAGRWSRAWHARQVNALLCSDEDDGWLVLSLDSHRNNWACMRRRCSSGI